MNGSQNRIPDVSEHKGTNGTAGDALVLGDGDGEHGHEGDGGEGGQETGVVAGSHAGDDGGQKDEHGHHKTSHEMGPDADLLLSFRRLGGIPAEDHSGDDCAEDNDRTEDIEGNADGGEPLLDPDEKNTSDTPQSSTDNGEDRESEPLRHRSGEVLGQDLPDGQKDDRGTSRT